MVERTYVARCSDGDECTGPLHEVVEWIDEHLDMVETLEPGLLHTVTIEVEDAGLPADIEPVRVGAESSRSEEPIAKRRRPRKNGLRW